MEEEEFNRVLDACYEAVRTLKKARKDFPEKFYNSSEEKLLENLEAITTLYEIAIRRNN
jgi:hypothetical protein